MLTHLTAALRLLAVYGINRPEEYWVSLELLCADDFGDLAHADVYDETKEKQIQVEERLAHIPGIQVFVADTDDKYSRHSDAYVRFNWHQVKTVVRVLNEVGITGDILDVPADFPPELEQQALSYDWEVERH